MTDTARATPALMPSVGRLLAAQISYQARLLAGGRTITIGVGLPVILLIASHGQHSNTSATDIAGYAAFGLTLTAWNTYGVRLVAAREAGVLKRWRATPSHTGATSSAASWPPSSWPCSPEPPSSPPVSSSTAPT